MIAAHPAPSRAADNPFAAHCVDRLAFRLRRGSWEQLERRLADLGGRVGVVGPKGSGKTALLDALAARAGGGAIRVRIPSGHHDPWRAVRSQLPGAVTPDNGVFVDGFEQLGPVGRRRLLKATRGARILVVTAHRPGPMPTLMECRTDPELLRVLVRKLAPTHAPRLEPRLADLFHRHRGNLRECFRELYDLYAGRADSGVRR